mmetsp:Transcript_54263/g.116534  ORF Transcript_54263/g.116534 Transcript_54263/m.116534 type:complete len:252 (+) Transcript_54263:969-1724(+)
MRGTWKAATLLRSGQHLEPPSKPTMRWIPMKARREGLVARPAANTSSSQSCSPAQASRKCRLENSSRGACCGGRNMWGNASGRFMIMMYWSFRAQCACSKSAKVQVVLMGIGPTTPLIVTSKRHRSLTSLKWICARGAGTPGTVSASDAACGRGEPSSNFTTSQELSPLPLRLRRLRGEVKGDGDHLPSGWLTQEQRCRTPWFSPGDGQREACRLCLSAPLMAPIPQRRAPLLGSAPEGERGLAGGVPNWP